MSDVPEGWVVKPVPELFEINPGKPPTDALPAEATVTFVPMPAVDADQGTIASPHERAFGEVRKGYTAFRNEDVILAKITPCFENGKAAIARGLTNGLGFGSSEFHVFRSRGAVTPDYLYHFLRQTAFRREAQEYMTGTAGQARVPTSYLEGIELAVPPLPEQKRIVAKIKALLAEVNAARDRLEKVPALLKRFRQSVLAAACSGSLTEDWRRENKNVEGAAALVKQAQLIEAQSPTKKKRERSEAWQDEEAPERNDEIPGTWCWSSVGTFVSDSFYGPRFSSEEYAESGVPTIRTSDIDRNGNIIFDNPPRLTLTKQQVTELGLQSGDLLVTRTGATIGKCALYRSDLGPAVPSAYLIRFRLRQECVDPQYVLTFLLSPYGQDQLLAGTTAVAQPNINAPTVKAVRLPLPPLAEQQEIVRRVRRFIGMIENLEGQLDGIARRSATLAQSILAKAFRGELVPTEAALARSEGREYESAAQLLARVHAERQAQEPVKVSKRKKAAERVAEAPKKSKRRAAG